MNALKENKAREMVTDRELLKEALIELLDDIPLERLKALYIKALISRGT